mmetsp:Transcript_42614/g.76392  ORF Transcript_42614/g.76392 Transcript_42614/m.76392 type:complete len:221 (+) Transcript_42614:310-972(+)
MNDRIAPSALEDTTIATNVIARPVDAVAVPGALVLGAVCPEVDADTLLGPIPEGSAIPGAFTPGLNTMALLMVVGPLTLELCGILVVVDALSVSDIPSPLSNVDVSINMCESTLAICLVCFPLTLIFGTIRPGLYTIAVPSSPRPLPFVNCARLESEWSARSPATGQFLQFYYFTLKITMLERVLFFNFFFYDRLLLDWGWRLRFLSCKIVFHIRGAGLS